MQTDIIQFEIENPDKVTFKNDNRNDIIDNTIDDRRINCELRLEISVTFLMCLICLFTYSYTNSLNYIIGLVFMTTLFNCYSEGIKKMKKILLIILLVINILDFIGRCVLLALLYSDIIQDLLEIINPFLLISKNNVGTTVLGIVSSFLLIIFNGALLIGKKWSLPVPQANKMKKQLEEILGVSYRNKEMIVAFGYLFISIGACMIPTTVGIAFLILILISSCCIMSQSSCCSKLVSLLTFIFIALLPIYCFCNYLISCNEIRSIFIEYVDKLPKFGIMLFYWESSEFYVYNGYTIIAFIFYLFGYFFINIYQIIKEKNPMSNSRVDKPSDFILFIKENPEMFLHLCRIGTIVWISFNLKYYSILFIVWLSLSMVLENQHWFKLITQYFLVIIFFFLFSISYLWNIKSLFSPFGDPILEFWGFEQYILDIEICLQMTSKVITLFFFGFYYYIYQLKKTDTQNTSILQEDYLHHKDSLSKQSDNEKQMNLLEDLHIKDEMNMKETEEIKKENDDQEEENEDDENEEEQENTEMSIELMEHKSKYCMNYEEVIFKGFYFLNKWLLVITLYLGISSFYSFHNGLLIFLLILLIIRKTEIPFWIYYASLCFLNIVFLGKYITFFFFPYSKEPSDMEQLLSLVYFDYLDQEIFLWIAMYCLYIRFCFDRSAKYTKYQKLIFSLDEFVDEKYKGKKGLKVFCHIINSLLFEIYIWFLFLIAFFMILLPKNNLFFLFMLLVLIIAYNQYINLVANKFSSKSLVIIFIKVLIISSILIFVLLYLWQIFQTEYIISLIPYVINDIFQKYMKLVGFIKCPLGREQLFPHFACMVLFTSLSAEIEKQINENTEPNKIQHSFYSKGLLNLLYYFLHYYWIVVFLVVSVLAIHWMLSVTMFFELMLFIIFVLKSYFGYYQCLKRNKKGEESVDFQIRQYEEEKKRHYQITSDNQQNYFSSIWIFTLICIVLSYTSCLVFQLMNYGTPNEYDVFLYIIGIYSESSDRSDYYQYAWGYFLIIAMFSIRAAFQRKYYDMQQVEEDQKLNEVNKSEEENEEQEEEEEEEGEGEEGNEEEEQKEQQDKPENEKKPSDNLLNFNDSIDKITDDKETIIKNKEWLKDPLSFKEEKKKDEINESLVSEEEKKDTFSQNKEPSNIIHSISDVASKMTTITIDNQIIYHKEFKMSVNLKVGMKKIVELIIIVLLLLSVFIKINVISFILLLCLVFIYQRKLNATIMLVLSMILVMLFIVQYCLFISNISTVTNPLFDTTVIQYLEQHYNLPWYKDIVGTKWGIFFCLGVSRFHITSLWIDIILLITVYFYLEFFSFSIFESQEDFFPVDLYTKKFYHLVDIQVLTIGQYQHFIKSMMMSYGIVLRESPIASDASINQEDENEKNNNGKPGKPKKKLSTKALLCYKYSRAAVFLLFHYITLLLILGLSAMNTGLISFAYIGFTLFYIYKSYSFLQGFKWTLLRGLRYVLKPFIFLDLFLQCVCQIPFDIFSSNKIAFIQCLNTLGLQQLVNYNSKEQFLNVDGLTFVFLKIFTFFLILLQEIIYGSDEFKHFILKYHLKYFQKTFINGKLNSFLFNNNRVRLMADRIEQRDEINDSLVQLEVSLTQWNSMLLNKGENRSKQRVTTIRRLAHIQRKQIKEKKKTRKITYNEEENSQFEENLSIDYILRKQWLIKMAIETNNKNLLINDDEIKQNAQVQRILKGNTSVETDLDRAIDKFVKDNQHKLCLSFLLQERVVKESKKEIEKRQKKETKEKNKKEAAEEKKKKEADEKTVQRKKEKRSTRKEADKKKREEQGRQIRMSLIGKEPPKDDAKRKEEEEKEYQRLTHDPVFFFSSDYCDFKERLREEFFEGYYSKGKIFWMILKSNLISSWEHFDYICYFFMVLNNIQNGSLLSIIYPIFVFVFGLMQYPRPARIFWKISIIYCSFVLFLKFFVQLNVLKETIIITWLKLAEPFVNLKNCATEPTSSFFLYVFVDFLLLISLLTNQFILVRKGLWNHTELDYETVEESHERIIKSNAYFKDNDMSKRSSLGEIAEMISTVNHGNLYSKTTKGFVKESFDKTFPSVRNEKPGKDFYFLYTIFSILILAYVVLFYSLMDKDPLQEPGTFLKSQFSSMSIILGLCQLIITVMDRYIYLKNSRSLKDIYFKIYDAHTGIDVTQDFGIETYEEAKRLCEETNDYKISCFHFEGPKRALVIKYILQIITVFGVHFLVFYYLPAQGYQNTKTNDNTVNGNFFIFIFYAFYCFYFIFSALQLKHGMLDFRKMPTLMQGSSIITSAIFKGYRAIPFLQELKAFIDWTFTITALDLFKWLKFEEVFALIFIAKCFHKSNQGTRVGTRVPKYMKNLLGVSGTVLLLIILFGPLFLFSNLNPTTAINNVNGANIQLSLSINEEDDVKRNFPLIISKNPLKITEVTEENYQYLQSMHTEIKTYEKSQMQNVTMMGYDESNWELTPKLLDYITKVLDDTDTQTEVNLLTFEIIFQYSFSTVKDPTQANYVGAQSLEIQKEQLRPFFKFIDSSKKCSEIPIQTTIDNFEANLRITANNAPKIITKNNLPVPLHLYLNCKNDKYYWTTSNTALDDQVTFIIYSDKYSSTTAGWDVITFYVSFVMVAGNLLRIFFVGEATRLTITEMVDPKSLLSICQGIRISRLRKDFLKEDKLYYTLIDLMRSPEIVKKITMSSLTYNDPHNLIKESERIKKEKTSGSIALIQPFSCDYRKIY